jgi:Fe-S cluster assembly iron-binding protein IscA
MLSITSSAANVLDNIREQRGVPEGFVVRVSPNETPNGLEIQVGFAPGPAEGDQVTETEGTTLCVDPDLAEPLDHTVIDAEQTPAGPELVLKH